MKETLIRKMNIGDLRNVQEIHLTAFPNFFLTFLGASFLKELYSGILNDSSGIAWVAENPGQLQGFVAGTDNPHGFYKRLIRKRWYRFAWASLFPILKQPTILPRLLRAFSRDQGEDVHENCATLMSIAVAPGAQGSGIGKLLIGAFLDETTNRGVYHVNLTTDKNNNDSVNAFYVKMGFNKIASFTTPEGREMNEYQIEINSVL